MKAGVGTGEGDGDEDELLDESRNGSSMAARTFVTSNCPTKKKGKSVLKSQFQCICKLLSKFPRCFIKFYQVLLGSTG